jgi:hypothetical protein
VLVEASLGDFFSGRYRRPLGEAPLFAEWFLVGEWEVNVCEGDTLPSINTFMFLRR